VVEIESIVKTS